MTNFFPTLALANPSQPQTLTPPTLSASFSSVVPPSPLNQGQLLQQTVNKPPFASAYRGLGTGPEMAVQFQPNTAPQVQGTELLLRQLSPFVIQVEPPLVYGQTPAVNSPVSVGTYTTAAQNSSGYFNARTALSRSGFGIANATASTATPFITGGSVTYPLNGKTVNGISTNPTLGNLGEPAIADYLAAIDISSQLNTVLTTPPLVLLINPTNMKVDYTKLQQFTDRTRYGYVFHAYGEEQPKISITARCGAFYSGGRGVSYFSKLDSTAWQNMMALFQFYKNNGYIYDTIHNSNAHYFVGVLSIHYDQWIYYGNMESFSWTYDEKNQNGGMEFQMSFTVSSMIDTAPSPTQINKMSSATPNPSNLGFSSNINLVIPASQSFAVANPGGTGYGSNTNPPGSTPVGARALIPPAINQFLPPSTTPPPTGSTGFTVAIPTLAPGGRPLYEASTGGVKPFGVTIGY